MEKDELIETVSGLIQLDIDTVYSYNQALDEIEDEIIRARLTEFRDMHQNHIKNLSDVIRTLGAEPPRIKKDLKGFVIEALTALRGLTGMAGALKALKTTEEITNRLYGEVVSKDVPSPLKEILREHFTDEKIHLDYIDSNLEALRW